MALPVRDYLYLDTRRLQDYMASVDPGSVSELRTVSRKEAGSENALPRMGHEQSGSKEENTLEQKLTVGDRNQFSRFYDVIKSDMPRFDEYTAIDMDRADRNVLIEATRTFERSPLTEMVDSLLEVAELMQQMGADEQREQANQMLSMMSFLMRDADGENKSYPMIAEEAEGSPSVLFVAQRGAILTRVDDFAGEMTLVGKVAKKIPEGQSIDLFDMLNIFPRSIRRMKSGPQSFKDLILGMFSTWPDQMGGPLPKEATELKGPAVIVSPLAAFT